MNANRRPSTSNHELAQPLGAAYRMAPASSYRWAILAVAFAVQAFFAALQQGMPILAPFLKTSFSLSLAQLGVLVTCFVAGLMVSSMPAGAVVDRLGERPGVAFGGIATFLVVVAALIFQRLVVVFGACLFLGGLFGGVIGSASSKSVVGWFSPRERGLAMGLRQIGVPAGSAFASVALPLMSSRFGWPTALAVAALLQLAAAGVFVAFAREPEIPSVRKAQAPEFRRAVWEVLSDRQLLLTSSISFVLVMTQYVLLAYLILYLTSLSFSLLAASSALLTVQLGAVAGRIVWGRVSDRMFDGARRPALRAASVMAAMAVFSLAFTTGNWPLWGIYLQLFLVGANCLGWNSLTVTLAAEISGYQKAGAGTGLNSAAVFAGALIAAPLFGLAADLANSYRVSFALLGVVTLAALIPLACVREGNDAERTLTLHQVTSTG